MRHRKAGRKLKRTASHRKATLSSLATSLLRHKRITTTVAKAKETRIVTERIITRAKRALAGAGMSGKEAGSREEKFFLASGHARREVGRLIKDRAIVAELFSTIGPKVASRPGGYTRIVKLGQRQGDGAELAVIELVDFHTGQEVPGKSASAKERKPEQGKKAEKGAKGSAPGKTEEKPVQNTGRTQEHLPKKA